MALADFIQALQEQEVVYSEPPKSSIRVIPPEKQSLRVLPPETSNDIKVENPHVSTNNVSTASPKTIKLKIKLKQVESPTQSASTFNNTQIETNKQQISKPIEHNSVEQIEKPKVEVSKPIESDMSKNTSKVSNSIIEPNIKKLEPEVVISQEPSQIVEKPKELTDEDIFNSTGTEYSKKELWFNYFAQAKNSRKKNPIVDRMKVGRFTITPDNKVLLLPDYDIVGKDPDDVLKDKWF